MDQPGLIIPSKSDTKPDNLALNVPLVSKGGKHVVIVMKREALTTKKAVELLLSGSLRTKVCRYCLHITAPLSNLDQIMHIAGQGAFYKVTIRDIVASFHPIKVVADPNFPNKICEKCLDKAIQSYKFSQQCEQAERALRNCFDDMYDKCEKLDPLERTHKRGRQKSNPNHNILHAESHSVLDYAEPIWNLVNLGSVSLTKETEMTELECKRCWQVLPNIESLVNHEKMHPKSMWYHCRICGKSFAKKIHITRHLKQHAKGKSADKKETDFVCKQCDHRCDNYNVHLQHIEKHKFKMVLEHLVERKMDELCSVCLDKNGKMEDLDKLICLHGGYPELTGDRTVYNILGSTVPEMNILRNHTGTKICEKCLERAVNSYIFINKTHYIRKRLNTCVTNMLESLKPISEPENKIFIEINDNSIMPLTDTFDDNLLLNEDEIDEEKLKVEVLEDEFRLKSESEESESEEIGNDKKVAVKNDIKAATKVSKVNQSTKLVNGFINANDNLGEFLTFKKKGKASKRVATRFACSMCNKKFIHEYFLRRHILKHVHKKVKCKFCWNPFRSKFHLREHTKVVHLLKLNNVSNCHVCGRTFKSEQKKLSHEKCHISRQCELCSKIFRSQHHYINHLHRHAAKFNTSRQKSAQNCSFCEKECSNDNSLSVHVNKVHLQIKPYSCDMCERQFYSEQNLVCHKKAHTVPSKEKCEFCSKLLKCRRDLVVHIRKHIGHMPHRCLVCTKTFYSEFKVKQHMKIWHGGSFCCKLCRKIFVNNKELKEHVTRTHSFF